MKISLCNNKTKKYQGFTIVEMLITILIIGILAGIISVSYLEVQKRARVAKIDSDLKKLEDAITIARLKTGQTTGQITINYFTAWGCNGKASGTDLAALNKTTDPCWTEYAQSLDRISEASGVDVRGLTDPWGRPYFIDENEGENEVDGDGGICWYDSIKAFSYPFAPDMIYEGFYRHVPVIGYKGCVPE